MLVHLNGKNVLTAVLLVHDFSFLVSVYLKGMAGDHCWSVSIKTGFERKCYLVGFLNKCCMLCQSLAERHVVGINVNTDDKLAELHKWSMCVSRGYTYKA